MVVQRSAFLVFSALLCSSAMASYELMLLPTASGPRVQRYDPENGVALGTFGQFGGAPSLAYVSTDQSGNVHVSNNSTTLTYNYSTGSQVQARDFPAGRSRISPSGNTIFGTFSGSVDYGSTTATNFFTINPVLTTVSAVVPYSDSVVLVVGMNSAGTGVATRYNGASFSTQSSVFGAGGITAGSMGSAQSFMSGSILRTLIPFRTSSNVHSILVVSQDAAGYSTGTSSISIGTSFGSSATLCILPSHIGYYVIGDDVTSASLTRIAHYTFNGVLISNYTTTAVDVPTANWAGSIVLAPEPGSLAALTLGLLALGRRRNTR